MKPSLPLLCAAALALLAPLAHAEVIHLNETFADGSRLDQNLPSTAAWYSSSTATNLFAGSGVLTQNIGSGGRHLIAYFADAPVTIAVGEVMEVTATISFNVPANVSGAFRVGLFNSNGGTRIAADNQGGTSAGNSAWCELYRGYRSDMNLVPAVGSTNVTLRKREPAIQGLLLANAAYDPQPSYTTSANHYEVLTQVPYTVTLSIHRTGENRVRISYQMTGANFNTIFATGQDETNVNSAFDSIAFGTTSNATSSFSLTQVTVRTYDRAPVAVDTPSLLVAPSDQNLLLVSSSQVGAYYRVQRTANLSGGTWANVGWEVPGTGGNLEWLISTAALPEGPHPQYFFRIAGNP